MCVRGIRGAITSREDSPEAIHEATRDLLTAIVAANPDLATQAIASAWFTVTDDLHSAYPAAAARALGWTLVPMMCGREIPVLGGLPRCIRILIHWNTELPQSAICHVYLGAATRLRPDLERKPPL
jgi:chorismate mutase